MTLPTPSFAVEPTRLFDGLTTPDTDPSAFPNATAPASIVAPLSVEDTDQVVAVGQHGDRGPAPITSKSCEPVINGMQRVRTPVEQVHRPRARCGHRWSSRSRPPRMLPFGRVTSCGPEAHAARRRGERGLPAHAATGGAGTRDRQRRRQRRRRRRRRSLRSRSATTGGDGCDAWWGIPQRASTAHGAIDVEGSSTRIRPELSRIVTVRGGTGSTSGRFSRWITVTTSSAVVTKWSNCSVASSNRPSSSNRTGRRTDQHSSRSMNTIGLRVPSTDT